MMYQGLRWNHQVDHALAKARKWTLVFCHLTRPLTGIGAKLMRQLYGAITVPKLTYAAGVWYTLIDEWAGRMNRCGSVGVTNRLASLQSLASIAITGALHMNAMDTLEIHTGILPMQLLMHKVCHREALRITVLPSSHPLHEIFCKWERRKIKMHRSPLHELAHIYKAHLKMVETISLIWLHPNYDSKICPLEEVQPGDQSPPSPSRDLTGHGATQVFMDGSGVNSQVGAAAVLFSQGQETRVLRYHLGTLLEHMVIEAKAMGVFF